MIEANCLVFPRPRKGDCRAIQDHLVYVPRSPSSCCTEIEEPTGRASSAARKESKNTTKNHSALSALLQTPISQQCIPCVFLKGSEQLIIYFHSNGEDLCSAFPFAQAVHIHTGHSLVMVEYPGYSVYGGQSGKNNGMCFMGSDTGKETKAEDIEQDAIRVIEYFKGCGEYCLADMHVMGRSIGSGPAVFLASLYGVRSLTLLSPFMSLRQAVQDMYGQVCASLLAQRFNNAERAKFVQCPVLLVHGTEDGIVPYRHSQELAGLMQGYTRLELVPGMKHNSFSFYQDFLMHVKNFYTTLGFE